MASPPGQLLPTVQVECPVTTALREATVRELECRNLLQVFKGTCSKAAAEVRRLEELCRCLQANADMWEENYHRVVSSKEADEAHFQAEKSALEEKVNVLQQELDAKLVKFEDHTAKVEHFHIKMLQAENAKLLEKVERLEEELNTATQTLLNVTKTVLALVGEVENSQPGEMFARHWKMNVRRNLIELPLEVSTPFEHNKKACYEAIRRAEAALVDATWVWRRAQVEAECMLMIGRKTIIDKILGRPRACE